MKLHTMLVKKRTKLCYFQPWQEPGQGQGPNWGHLTYRSELTFIILQDPMLVPKNIMVNGLAWHVLFSVCLLSSNLNSLLSNRNWNQQDTIGIEICPLKINIDGRQNDSKQWNAGNTQSTSNLTQNWTRVSAMAVLYLMASGMRWPTYKLLKNFNFQL